MPVRGDDEHGQFSVEGPPPQSDADGRFELEVEAGDYQLLVLGGGPRPRTRTKFTAIAGQIVELGDVEVGEAAPPPPPSPSPPPPPP
jgi:hypothetical protein